MWATLADTALVVYERFVEPLSPEAREDYYADHRVLARVLGVPPALVPRDLAAFRVWFEAMVASDVLTVTPLAREIARAVLEAPGDPGAARMVRSITAGLLPPRLREAFGLSWDAEDEARLEALAASVRSLRGGAVAASGRA